MNPTRVAMTVGRKAASTALLPVHRRLARKHGSGAPTHPVVFLIGPPRSGSTALYQLITRHLDVTYTDNLACQLHRAWLAGLVLSKAASRGRPHESFASEHGATRGWHSPSECGEYWYRWLPRDRHFIDRGEISARAIAEIRSELVAAVKFFDRPLVFKNLNSTVRLRLLHDVLPEARFVFCRRERRYVLQSILEARRRIQVAAGSLWSVRPRVTDDFAGLPEWQQVAEQILRVEDHATEDLKALFPSEQLLVVDYLDTCNTPGEVIADIAAFAGARVRAGVRAPEMPEPRSERWRLDEALLRTVSDYFDARPGS